MIKEVIIQNYQCHKDSELVFHPGLNALIGETDNGKSALKRALVWAIFNKPDGTSFMSHWTKSNTKSGKVKVTGNTGVQVVSSRGAIERFRGPEGNGYRILQLDEDDDEQYDALRGTVPEPITEILQIRDMNVQNQMDGPFMLSETPSAVASRFNEVVNLEEIGESLDAVGTMRRTHRTQEKSLSIRSHEVTVKLANLDWIPTVKGIIDELAEMHQTLETGYSESETMAQEITKAKGLKTRLEAFPDLEIAKARVQDLKAKEKKVLEVKGEYRAVGAKLLSIKSLQSSIARHQGIPGAKRALGDLVKVEALRDVRTEELSNMGYHLERAKDLQEDLKNLRMISRAVSRVEKLEKTEREISTLENDLYFMTELQGRAIVAQSELRKTGVSLKRLQEEFDIAMPDVCPLCGRGEVHEH